MAFKGGEAAVPNTATSITSLLGLTDRLFCKQIIIQSIVGAANPVCIGGSNVTTSTNRRHVLAAGNAVTIGGGDRPAVNTSEVFIIGTVAGTNIVFFTLIE